MLKLTFTSSWFLTMLAGEQPYTPATAPEKKEEKPLASATPAPQQSEPVLEHLITIVPDPVCVPPINVI